jgi:hypothetical protein
MRKEGEIALFPQFIAVNHTFNTKGVENGT